MMLGFPLLSMLIFLPLLGAVLVLLARPRDAIATYQNPRAVALWVSIATLLLALALLAGFQPDMAGMQFVERQPWIPAFAVEYFVGVDGLSLLLILLTALLTPLCILASWRTVTERAHLYYASFLALEGLVIGVFSALDFVLFYVFWEAMLIPMFLIIGMYGGEHRVYAALKFFLYTFVGSVLMLGALVYLYVQFGTFDILVLQTLAIPDIAQYVLFLCFFAAFAVKIPMFPFHTWLPDAHVQAPTAGSVILAGVLLKLGGYGFLRVNLPMFPDASAYFAPAICALSVMAIVWAALVAFAQTDIKKMIAYSSVSHMGFVTLGIFALTPDAINGAVFQMLSHGLISAGLFLAIGVLYDRLHTRNITYFGGVAAVMPKFALVLMLLTFASVAVPGTSSFVGEFMVLLGSFPVAQGYVLVAISGVVLGAVYMLWLVRKVLFGPTTPKTRELVDLSLRELWLFVPLLVLALWLGVQPQAALDYIQPVGRQIMEGLE